MGGFAESVATDVCDDFATALGGYAAGREAERLFYIIQVIADSFGLWGGFRGAAPITRVM